MCQLFSIAFWGCIRQASHRLFQSYSPPHFRSLAINGLLLLVAPTFLMSAKQLGSIMMQTVLCNRPQDEIQIVAVTTENIIQIAKITNSTLEQILLPTYRMKTPDSQQLELVIGNKDRVKGIQTLQKGPHTLTFTWTSYGNKTRTLDMIEKELVLNQSESIAGLPTYRFSHEGKRYIVVLQRKAQQEICTVTLL